MNNNIKNKLTAIFIITILLISFLIFEFKKDNFEEYTILKVIDTDTYCIDFNKNNSIDFFETVKLYSITGLKPIKNENSIKIAKKLSISQTNYLKAGLLAQSWAKDNLSGKKVKVKIINKNSKYPICKIYYNNQDLSEFLLKSGFAINEEFDGFKSTDLINKNISYLKGIKFYIVNEKNNKIHDINCKYAKLTKRAKLVIIKNSDFKGFDTCSYCIKNKNSKDNAIEDYNIIKNLKNYPKSYYKKFSDIELFLINPHQYKKPNTSCNTDICKRLVFEINNSKKSIDIAIYGFGYQKEIYNALINAKKRGVKIRAVVDYSKKQDEIYPLTSEFIREFEAKTDSNEILMHNKFIIFDDIKVFTGTANISPTGTGGYNSNNGLIINSECLSKIYKEEFEQMHQGRFSKNKAKIENTSCKVNNHKTDVYFSPKNDIFNEVFYKLLNSAQKEIFISIFYLTDKNFINGLIKAKSKGVNVMVLIDSLCAINYKDRIELLRNNKIPVKVENWGGKNHEKTMVIDSKIFVTGSLNFSKSGFYKNDENVLVIENPEIAALYRDYYLYLFNRIDNKYLKLYPTAESKDSKYSCNDGIDNDFDGKIDINDEGCRK